MGENVGQSAKGMFSAGWRGRIISFEPLSEAHRALTSAARGNVNWEVADRCALGSTPGRTEINISRNSQSSSLLPMLHRHVEAAPQSAYIGKESIDVMTLDQALAGRPGGGTYLLKMDVQGFERAVLDGAKETLRSTPIIFTEMSLQPLYGGEAGFADLSAHIMSLGYKCVSLTPAYIDDRTGEMLQVDGLFVSRTAEERF